MVYQRDPLKGVGMGFYSKRNPKFREIVWRRQRELVEAVTGKKFTISCVCRNSNCAHKYTEWEVLNWFDVDGFTVECPDCSWHSEPRMAVVMEHGANLQRIETPFYGPSLVLDRLRQYLKPIPVNSRGQYAFCNSAVVHFGSLERAYALLGMEYPFGEKLDWTERVDPFLGRLPDTVIAGLLGTDASRIRRLRRDMRISPFDSRRVLSSAGDEVRTS